MGVVVIACYRPKPGKSDALRALVRSHVEILRKEDLASMREPIVMRAKDGAIVEVFEWRSAGAIDEAHSNPVVKKMWERFEEVCDYATLSSLSEATEMFAGFDPIDYE